MNDNTNEHEVSRLRWRCRRGMRELDEALLAWLDERYPDASEDERIRFRELIDMEDPELFGLLTGKIKEDRYAELVSRIGKTLQGRAG